MLRTLLGITGGLLLAVALVFAGALALGGRNASALDRFDRQNGMVIGEPPCPWNATMGERVMSENETRTVVVSARNDLGETCKSQVRLTAPGFSASPRGEEQTLSVANGRSGSVAWVMTPGKIGTYEILLSDGLTTEVIGVRVTDVLGLSAGQARVLSTVGTVFGPMCTFPWWLDKWMQRRKRNDKAPAEAKPKPDSAEPKPPDAGAREAPTR